MTVEKLGQRSIFHPENVVFIVTLMVVISLYWYHGGRNSKILLSNCIHGVRFIRLCSHKSHRKTEGLNTPY